jgi:hypothetical protein
MGAMKPAAVSVRIGELEIEGLSEAGRHDVARGLQLELVRLLSESGIPPRLLVGEPCQPQLRAPPGLVPLEVGRAVAQALYAAWR